jgi:TRAP-type C4-dicarboxylate transport system permease small subunit
MGIWSKLGDVIIKVLLVVASVALMVMMVIVVGNSLGRAFFKTPIFGTIEIAGLAGVIVVAVAVGFAQWEQRNVVVDVVANRFTPRTREIADAFTLFLSLGAVAFMFWAIFNDALNSVAVREIALTTGIPTFPFKLTWAIGVIILCLFLLQHMIETIRKGGKK